MPIALCVDLYVCDGASIRRRGTVTHSFSVLSSSSASLPILDWAAVRKPERGDAQPVPPCRGTSTLVFVAAAVAGKAGGRASASSVHLPPSLRDVVIPAVERLFLDGVAVLKRMQESTMRRCANIAGVDKCIISPIRADCRNTCRLPGCWVAYYAGTPRAFSASDAWFRFQVQSVLNERGDFRAPICVEAITSSVVMEACVLWIASQPYVNDTLFSGDGTSPCETCDTPTNAFLGTACNCKDDARGAYRVLMWLIFTPTATFADPVVVHSQRIARRFVPMLCFGVGKKLFDTSPHPVTGSHVYTLAVPVHEAVRMATATATPTSSSSSSSSSSSCEQTPWYAAALRESREESTLALEGTCLVSSNMQMQMQMQMQIERANAKMYSQQQRPSAASSSSWAAECEAAVFARAQSPTTKFWTRAHPANGMAAAMYVATCNTLTAWFERVKGVPAFEGVKRKNWLSSDGGMTIGIRTTDLMLPPRNNTTTTTTFVPFPYDETPAAHKIVQAALVYERAAVRMLVSPAKKDALFKLDATGMKTVGWGEYTHLLDTREEAAAMFPRQSVTVYARAENAHVLPVLVARAFWPITGTRGVCVYPWRAPNNTVAVTCWMGM